MTGQAPVRVGFYGKLPSRGDFVRAGLSRRLVTSWDEWVQPVLSLVCLPDVGVWHFALAAGVCGRGVLAGVWLPSADRVGRPFPLLVAAEAAEAVETFLDAAERVGLDAIRTGLAPAELAERLQALPPPAAAGSARVGARVRWWRNGGVAFTGEALPDAAALKRQ